jgi:hypothetical protein
MKLELNPETVHGLPAVVAAIVIALWDGAAVSSHSLNRTAKINLIKTTKQLAKKL